MSFNNIQNTQYTYDFNAYLEIGSFEYIPKHFLGIDTSTFGVSNKLTKNPFLALKEKIMCDKTPFEDKCQGVRYMCHIPFRNGLQHTLECCKNILENDNYPIDQRFYFFANNEKYFKLEDHVVFHCYPLFFELCMERNYPLSFTLMCCKYILSTIPDTELVMKVKNLLYKVSEDVCETIQIRAEAIDTLLEYGNRKDKDFANNQLSTLGDNYIENLKGGIYNNLQNVHNETITESIRNMLRTLLKEDLKIQKEYKDKGEKEFQVEDIHQYILSLEVPSDDNELNEQRLDTLHRIMTDPSKYEGKNLCEIMLIVWRRIHTFEESVRKDLLTRFIQELDDMKNTCSFGHLSRILNILSGYIISQDYQLKISPKDNLRSSIFARLNAELRRMGGAQQEEMLEALASQNEEDKQLILEFINYHFDKEDLQKQFDGLLSEEEFDSIYQNTINEYIGLIPS